MKRTTALAHEFVEYIPNDLKEGTIYVSVTYATAVHMCCCGCGKEVVTPLSPTDWELIFDGQTISLDPSIGNWNFPCQSHYWIRRNKVIWARRLSRQEIEKGRSYERLEKERYFDSKSASTANDTNRTVPNSGENKSNENVWWKLKNRWF
jgi:hypothetical protein